MTESKTAMRLFPALVLPPAELLLWLLDAARVAHPGRTLGLRQARVYYKGGGMVRVTVHKGRNVKVSMRPLQNFTHLLSVMPALEEGEGVTVEAEEGSVGESRSEESDAMAEQECLFGANAMPNKPVCRVCEATAPPGARITPMAWGVERRGGERGIRYYCHKCRSLGRYIEGEKIGKCPIPEEVFTERRLDEECPTLRREVGREEFDEWMRKLPKGKSGGPDEMTYEMWQEAPDPMRELLWRSVNSVLAGSQLPEEWAGAFTKLIVKKAGAEGALEDLRPVCLMSTAAKIITGIWAHRLLTTLEAKGVLEDVQEGFRPERSTKRQVMRLLNCINDAKRNGEKRQKRR